MKRLLLFGFVLILMYGCGRKESDRSADTLKKGNVGEQIFYQKKDSVIIDCNYTFEEATEGCSAPKELLEKLALYEVTYYSTDGRLHQGQLLSDSTIRQDMQELFDIMREEHFVIEKVIPIVRYDWNDDLSMADNNTYCFCFRDASYSFHAVGLAVDINPYFNPQRWKGSYRQIRKDKPEGAVYDPSRSGTFTEGSRIVEEFRKRGFRWGHYMSRKADDHHFQKASFREMPKVPHTAGRPAEPSSQTEMEEMLSEKAEIGSNESSGMMTPEEHPKTARERIRERAQRGKQTW